MAVVNREQGQYEIAKLSVGGSNVPASLTFTAASAGSNVCEVTIQATDKSGASVAGVFSLDVYLSDAATGVGLTATSASGTVAAKTASGADIGTFTAKKALRVQTLATGAYILEITDTAKTTFYVVGVTGLGVTKVSAILATGDYG
jgi:hypothetical protein